MNPTLPQYEDCVLTSDTLTLASKSDVVVIRGVDLRQAKFIPTTAEGSTTTVYVIHLLDVNGKEYLLALGSLADQKTWTNTASGAAQALRDIRVVMGEGGGGGGGGTVDSIVAGNAIDVDATDAQNPIVSVLVDGVTIGINGSNQLEVPAGGGGYVPTTRTISTTAPLTGGGDLSANRTFAVSDFTNGARGTVPASGGGTTNFLRADQTWAAPPDTTGITQLTGDGTAGPGSGSQALTLATVNAGVGTFGSATQTPVLTANAKGLITAISNTTVTPAVGSITGLGTGVATALAINVGTAGAPVVNGGALGTPSSGVATNLTGSTAAAGTSNTNLATNAFVQQELALQNPSFLTYSGGSQVYAVTTLADVNSTSFTFPSTGFYHVQYTVTHDCNATTTGIALSVNGTAVSNYLAFMTQYRGLVAGGRDSIPNFVFDQFGAATNSTSTTNNRALVDVWINVTTAGTILLRAASGTAVANAITITDVKGFMKKESN